MPRYRKLHVKVVESHDVNDMPDDFTRLFWVLLPLGLCQEGRGVDNAGWVKGKLFPMRFDVTPEMIEGAMSWLAQRGMISRYSVEGRAYFCIPNETWHKYQGQTVREATTEYPPPPDPHAAYSRPTPDPLTIKSISDAHAAANAHADAAAHAGATDQLASGEDENAPAAVVVAPLKEDLLELGLLESVAENIVTSCEPPRITAWIDHVRDSNGKYQSVPRFLNYVLLKTKDMPPTGPPALDPTSKEARRRYATDYTMPIEEEPP